MLMNGNNYRMKFTTEDISGKLVEVKNSHFSYKISNNTDKVIKIESFNLISFDLRRDNRSIYFGHVSFANKGLTNAMPSYFEVEPGNVLKVSLFKPMEIEMFKNLDIVELENEVVNAFLLSKGTVIEIINNETQDGEDVFDREFIWKEIIAYGKFDYLEKKFDTTYIRSGVLNSLDPTARHHVEITTQGHLLLENVDDVTAYIYGPSEDFEYRQYDDSVMDSYIIDADKTLEFSNKNKDSVGASLVNVSEFIGDYVIYDSSNNNYGYGHMEPIFSIGVLEDDGKTVIKNRGKENIKKIGRAHV